MYAYQGVVPYAYAVGGIGYMKVCIPASTGRMYVKEYTVQVLDELLEDNTRVVGQYRRTLVSDTPTSVYEINYSSGLFVPNISEVRIKTGTFSQREVMNRLRKLHFDVDSLQFEVYRDIDWTVYKNVGIRCGQIASVVSYKPRAFRPTTVSTGSEISVASSNVSSPVPAYVPEASQPIQSSTPQSHSTEDISLSPSISMTSEAPRTEAISVEADDSKPSASTYGSDTILRIPANTEYSLNGKYYHSAKEQYAKYNPQTGAWHTFDSAYRQQHYQNSPSTTYSSEVVGSIESGSAASGFYTTQPSSGSSNNGDYGNAPVYGNTGSSSIEWGSGQTSQTVTSGGSVHTIYR